MNVLLQQVMVCCFFSCVHVHRTLQNANRVVVPGPVAYHGVLSTEYRTPEAMVSIKALWSEIVKVRIKRFSDLFLQRSLLPEGILLKESLPLFWKKELRPRTSKKSYLKNMCGTLHDCPSTIIFLAEKKIKILGTKRSENLDAWYMIWRRETRWAVFQLGARAVL